MRIHTNTLTLSASDLTNHLGCAHLTALDRAVTEGCLGAPAWRDPSLEVLRERGFLHERAYLDHLCDACDLSVVDCQGDRDERSAFERTVAAMRAGADVISQATLRSGRWMGRADVLRRVEVPSDLGNWSYEVLDTKLARETRAGAVLQLCLYSDIVGEIQGHFPEFMHVVSPGHDFEPETFWFNDYRAYYRWVRRRLEDSLSSSSDERATYPEPVEHCDVCRWWAECDRRRHADDHLSLVAGISRLQRVELDSWGVETLESLAKMSLPLEKKPARGSADGLVRVREQARVQLEGRLQKAPVHELILPIVEGQGVARLPEPSLGDVFFDIEGDPFAGEAGQEYLFGYALSGPDGRPRYDATWALDASQEKQLFESFVDSIMDRWVEHPEMHVYHYAPYEPSALKRLMGRYATREDEIDRMLRAGLFVDLYAVVKQAVRASVERYSIKDLEVFYGFERSLELTEASKNLRVVEHALELDRVEDITDEVRERVESYNRDDCVSALLLREWLEGLRSELVKAGRSIPRPEVADGQPSDALDENIQNVRALMERLAGDVPAAPEDRSEEQHARWILAQLLDWHRRENKSAWWEYFRLKELTDQELLDEQSALSGLMFVDHVGGTAKCPIHKYEYAAQDSTVRSGDELHSTDGGKIGEVVEIDQGERCVFIKKTSATAEMHPSAVFAFKLVRPQPLPESLFALGEWVADHGMDADGPHRAARDLLLRRKPRLVGDVLEEKTGRVELADLSKSPLAPLCERGEFLGDEQAFEPSVGSESALAPFCERGELSSSDVKAESLALHASALRRDGEETVDAARRLALELDGGVLPIQGPPGAGKTYVGARMVCELVRAGKKVGITATSHKVIENLLQGVVAAAAEKGVDIRCIQKVSKKPDDTFPSIIRVTSNEKVLNALVSGDAQVGAGTAWLWAREDFFEAVDVLIVDEAGQMSLANVLAAAQAAKSIVLLGDPQQLDQPQQGTHPDGVGVSALEHLFGNELTVSPDRGLFLDKTWRLHPKICDFTSEIFYQGRLTSTEGLERQILAESSDFDGAGLWFVPVEHSGNTNSSLEEVECVADLVESLVSGSVSWTDKFGKTRLLSWDDILVIAPYNAHVAFLSERLPKLRVGTVDKFQGQEAPVVIYTMATSTPEDAPRGMEFLYSANRLNVATSRALSTCILVANQALFEPECRTPRQMQLANAFCRYLEVCEVVSADNGLTKDGT